MDKLATLFDWLKKNYGLAITAVLMLIVVVWLRSAYNEAYMDYRKDCNRGLKSEFLWMKCNQEQYIHDTVRLKESTTKSELPAHAPIIYNPIIQYPIKARRIDTTPKIQNIGPVKNQNNGINNGHIGDETYDLPKQREASQKLINAIIAKCPQRFRTILYNLPANDAEALQYVDDIQLSLYLKGYLNFKVSFYIGSMLSSDYDCIDGVELKYINDRFENIEFERLQVTVFPPKRTSN